MNKKHYLGRTVTGWEKYTETEEITGVALLKDENTEVFAGGTSGYVLEVDCPYATQAMADNILSSVRGRKYKGYKANGAALSIDAELGDGITANGLYSVLARQTLTFGAGHTSEIAAPGEKNINHEFPYLGKEKRANRRIQAEMWSAIEKNAETITLEVGKITTELENYATIEMTDASIELAVSQSKIYTDGKYAETNQKYTELKVTLDGVTVTDSDGVTKIKGGSIETSTLQVSAANITGTLTASQIDATNLKVQAANIEGELTASKLTGDLINISNKAGTIYGSIETYSNGGMQIMSGNGALLILSATTNTQGITRQVAQIVGRLVVSEDIIDGTVGSIAGRILELDSRVSALERIFG